MVYVQVQVKLSKQKAKKLLEGETVKISPKDFVEHSEESAEDAGQPVFLTKTQLKKISAGPADIKFSNAQIKRHLKSGSGFWGSLARVAAPILIPIAADLAKKGIDALASKGQQRIQQSQQQQAQEQQRQQQQALEQQLMDQERQRMRIFPRPPAEYYGYGVEKKKRGRPRKQHPELVLEPTVESAEDANAELDVVSYVPPEQQKLMMPISYTNMIGTKKGSALVPPGNY